MFPGNKSHYAPEDFEGNLHFVDVMDRSEIHSMPVLVMKHPKPDANTKWLVYFHGNRSNLQTVKGVAEVLHSLGVNCHFVGAEYRGYGCFMPDGRCTEAISIQDACTVMDFVIRKLKANEKDIVVCGRSIGTGVACAVALRYKKISGLVLISPFTSIKGAAVEQAGFFGLFMLDRFKNVDAVKKIACPTLVLQAEKDEIFPPHHGRWVWLQSAAACKKFKLMKGVNHNDISWKEVGGEVKRFVDILSLPDLTDVRL
jgi:pimeloyl-ACP methyl ester carboxylesterase